MGDFSIFYTEENSKSEFIYRGKFKLMIFYTDNNSRIYIQRKIQNWNLYTEENSKSEFIYRGKFEILNLYTDNNSEK